MPILRRLVRFAAMTAWDVFLPKAIEAPLKVGYNFYHCFLAADPSEQQLLLLEAGELSEAQLEQAAKEIVAAWQKQAGGTPLPTSSYEVARRLLDALRQVARDPERIKNPAESLRESINLKMLADSRNSLQHIHLSQSQSTIGSLVVANALAGGAEAADSPDLPADAPKLDGYQLLRLLGRGGFATVYLARYRRTDELCAVKVGELGDPRRLQREIQVLKKLRAPHLVRYYEHGELGKQYWIAMEYLGEHSLQDLLNVPGRQPTLDQALTIAEQILAGLEALHKHGILHRDLKPANVMVDENFRLRLIDFGLAKPFAEPVGLTTRPGELIGTPAYMSPEQVRGVTDLTPATDLWSFGVMLYELFTSAPPFRASTIMALGADILNQTIDLNVSTIPDELRPLLEQCLERDPTKRLADAAQAGRIFTEAVTRLRLRVDRERYQRFWQRVVDESLLEQFAAEHVAGMPVDAVERFAQYARLRGAEPADRDRLRNLLPKVADLHQPVHEAGQQLRAAKTRLQAEALQRTSRELGVLTREIGQLEGKLEHAQQRLRHRIWEQLTEVLTPLPKVEAAPIPRVLPARASKERQLWALVGAAAGAFLGSDGGFEGALIMGVIGLIVAPRIGPKLFHFSFQLPNWSDIRPDQPEQTKS